MNLDAMIADAAPPTTASTELDAAVAELVERTRPSSPARRWAVRVGVGAVGLGVLAGGAAAASTAIDWEPWLAQPDGVFEFVTPSGQECEGRAAVDDGQQSEAAEVAALEAVLHDRTVFDRALAAAETYLVADPAKHPDRLYIEAVADSYSRAVGAEVVGQGAAEIGWGFQIQCPGAAW